MTPTLVIPNLYQLVVPTPFAVGPVNVYLSTGADEPLTLVDTGPCTDRARAALEEGVSSLGYALSDIERIIITHAHVDHYGLAGEIARLSGASVYSHPNNRPILEDHSENQVQRRVFYEDLLVEAGVPREVRTTLNHVMRGFRRFASAVPSLHELVEGDALMLTGHTWQVLFMPGHASGLVCLYQPETQVLLSNDHLLRDISSNPFVEPPPPGQARRRRSLVDYIASLQRTAALDIAVAWPGHGEPIQDHRALIESRLAFHHRRAEAILAALQDGPCTAYALSQVLFPGLNMVDYFLAISEVLAHLEWLEAQGGVTALRQNGLMLWKRETQSAPRITF
jgi:glyoxylase-like metal-dependent hydrolase (beta-lactamase superfamily II)